MSFGCLVLSRVSRVRYSFVARGVTRSVCPSTERGVCKGRLRVCLLHRRIVRTVARYWVITNGMLSGVTVVRFCVPWPGSREGCSGRASLMIGSSAQRSQRSAARTQTQSRHTSAELRCLACAPHGVGAESWILLTIDCGVVRTHDLDSRASHAATILRIGYLSPHSGSLRLPNASWGRTGPCQRVLRTQMRPY